jgi:hypothetical protein
MLSQNSPAVSAKTAAIYELCRLLGQPLSLVENEERYPKLTD